MLAGSLPPNWPRRPPLRKAIEVVKEDGIPLVYLPRMAIVTELLDAADRTVRIAIIEAHSKEIAEDCANVLAEVVAPTLAPQRDLAQRAVDAFQDGHHETAQALAVVVAETAIAQVIDSKYAKVIEQVSFYPAEVLLDQLRISAAVAPIVRFYTAWHPHFTTPKPEALSRHVSVHQADPGHYTLANAILAIMLVSSVLRAFQEIQDHFIDDDPDRGSSASE